jgi:hypothetical protein
MIVLAESLRQISRVARVETPAALVSEHINEIHR